MRCRCLSSEALSLACLDSYLAPKSRCIDAGKCLDQMQSMKNSLKFTLSLMSLLSVPWAHAEGPVYVAGFGSAKWLVEGSAFECTFSHKIPSYGEAVFYRQAGEAVIFYLNAIENEMAAGSALLSSVAPSWRQGLPAEEIAYVEVSRSNRPVNLNAPQTRVVMAELVKGMMPTLTRQAWYDEARSIRVAISPVNFQGAYQNYQDCVIDLLPANFAQLERSSVFWKSGQMELDGAGREVLNNVIAYIKADSRVYSIQINGFTDTAGPSGENLESSRLRAFAVHNYLVSNGVNEAMLETRYFGETEDYLIVRNESTASERDRNRRVTLLLRKN